MFSAFRSSPISHSSAPRYLQMVIKPVFFPMLCSFQSSEISRSSAPTSQNNTNNTCFCCCNVQCLPEFSNISLQRSQISQNSNDTNGFSMFSAYRSSQISHSSAPKYHPISNETNGFLMLCNFRSSTISHSSAPKYLKILIKQLFFNVQCLPEF